MQYVTRWQRLRERLLMTMVLIIVCVPLVLGVYQFGVMLSEPVVGIVLAVFVLQEIVWNVGPIIWKE